MLSSVLTSDRAIQLNILIMRVFTRIRQMLTDNTELRLAIEKLERKSENHTQNIGCSIQQLESHFVHEYPNSKTRKNNYEKYLKYIYDLKELLGERRIKQWINGSFVTQALNPNDIDLVTFVNFEKRMRYGDELKRFEASGANEIYGVDAYLLTVFPEDHPKYFLFQSDKAYWMNQFGMTRRDKNGKKTPKGFIEIIY
jgi:hypothetical protein